MWRPLYEFGPGDFHPIRIRLNRRETVHPRLGRELDLKRERFEPIRWDRTTFKGHSLNPLPSHVVFELLLFFSAGVLAGAATCSASPLLFAR